MRIDLTSNRIQLDSTMQAHVADVVRTGFRRQSARLVAVKVHLADISGPRGRSCKRCRVVVDAAGCGTVVVKHTAESIYVALSRAARRAVHTVRRRLASQKTRRSQASIRRPAG